LKVRTVGYYKEMPHGRKSDISIYDFINRESEENIDRICDYLNSGETFIVSPGVVEDVINPDKGTAGDTSTYTDGEWFWPGDLSYYVRNYRLRLPDEFISSMEKNKWKVEVTFEDLNYEEIEADGVKI